MRIGESAECSKSELDLFSIPPTQTSVEEGFFDDLPAQANFDSSSTIRIDITGDSGHYINLAETEIHISGYFCKKGDTEIANTTKIGIVNNLLGSLFKQAEISINNKTVENTNSTLPFRDYIVKTLGLSASEKVSQLAGNIYSKDTPERFNSFLIGANEAKNNGWMTRRALIHDKNPIQLQGKLSCDIFNLDHIMVNNVTISLKLTKSDPKFYMLGDGAADHYFKYEDVFLRVKRHVISPSVMEAHALTAEVAAFKYPLTRMIVKPFVIPHASTKYTITKICEGVMPSRFICGFLKTSAFDGAYAENPYDFQNLGLQEIILKLNSRSLPNSSEMVMDYPHKILDGYRSLAKLTRDLDLTLDEYRNGYSLYSFDLNPDIASNSHYSSLKDGQIDLEIKLKTALDTSHTLVVLAVYKNVIQINKHRQPEFDYIV